jgi:predicted ribosome quality control (RQC) complex YloA/Tae2 family protein
MPKQKFNNFDICAEVACLRKRCVGMWLTNVYDLDNKRTFLFKFSRSGRNEGYRDLRFRVQGLQDLGYGV